MIQFAKRLSDEWVLLILQTLLKNAPHSMIASKTGLFIYLRSCIPECSNPGQVFF